VSLYSLSFAKHDRQDDLIGRAEFRIWATDVGVQTVNNAITNSGIAMSVMGPMWVRGMAPTIGHWEVMNLS